MKGPFISVVISTKNEESNLPFLLKSLRTQTYKKFEMLVVDNGSEDKTKSIAKKYGAKVFEKGFERSAQRNYGAKKSKGDWVLFLDADMILSERVLEDCAVKTQQKGLKAVVVPEKSIGQGFWAKCKSLERSFYEGVQWIEAARLYEKKVFVRLGGYDESLTGPEDFDLPQRLKERFNSDAIGRLSSYILHNEGNLSLNKTLKKKFYYGKKMSLYFAKAENKRYVAKQSSLLNRYFLFFSHPARLFATPMIGLGMLFMKTLEMIAIVAGVISQKLLHIQKIARHKMQMT